MEKLQKYIAKHLNLKTPDTVHRHLNCGTLFECIHITSNKCYKITYQLEKILIPKV